MQAVLYTHTPHHNREKAHLIKGLHSFLMPKKNAFSFVLFFQIKSVFSLSLLCSSSAFACFFPSRWSGQRFQRLGALRVQSGPVQPTLAQLRKAGMSRTGTFRVRALTRRLRSSVRRTTSLRNRTGPSEREGGKRGERKRERTVSTCAGQMALEAIYDTNYDMALTKSTMTEHMHYVRVCVCITG